MNIFSAAGWNWIGYIPNYSLPINDALSSVPAQTGDLIKSQVAFAQYINPQFGWIGNLKYMQPPNGYQLKISTPGTLIYPPPTINKAASQGHHDCVSLLLQRPNVNINMTDKVSNINIHNFTE